MNHQRLRSEAWNGLLDAARLTRYYQGLSDRYHRAHLWLRITLAAASFGILSPSLFDIPADKGGTEFSILAGVLVAVCVIADLVGRFSDKGALLHQVAVDCKKAEDAWRILWNDNDDPSHSPQELTQRYQELLGQDATEAVGKAQIIESKKLNHQCWEDVLKVETHRYAA